MIQSETDFSFSFSLPPCSRSNGIIIIQRDFARTNEPRDCFGYLETRRGLRGSGKLGTLGKSREFEYERGKEDINSCRRFYVARVVRFSPLDLSSA